MKYLNQRHLRTVVSAVLAFVVLSLAACGGDSIVDAARGYDPTPTPSPSSAPQ